MLFGSVGRGWAPARGPLVLSGVALLAGMVVLFEWVDWPALGDWARPLAVPLSLFAVATGGLAVAVARRRDEQAPRTRPVGMSWWVVVAAAVVVAAVGWAATSWLLGEANRAGDADKRAAARVEAIKTGLGVGAGTTGIFALLLAVRRQQHNESDATEKNVTELYTKAADQLGSEEAPVRLAGLYALERLAHNNPGQRQSIVNVICAYLRMPFTSPDAQPPAVADEAQFKEHHRRVQEREVRLAAQRIITEHLNPEERRPFWPDIDLDLTNAHLIDFTLENCRARSACFDSTTFVGNVFFSYANFTGPARFNVATFTGRATFFGVRFTGAWFRGANFTRSVQFNGANFTSDALFNGANFTGDALFDGANFTRGATFNGATFTGNALFSGAHFSGVGFSGAAFTGNALFSNATFTSGAYFRSTTFTGETRFDDATFSGETRFDGATFIGETRFDDATLTGGASFDGATFVGDVQFCGAKYKAHERIAEIIEEDPVGRLAAAEVDAAEVRRHDSIGGFGNVTVVGGATFARVTLLDSQERRRAVLRATLRGCIASCSAIVDRQHFRTVMSEQPAPAANRVLGDLMRSASRALKAFRGRSTD